MESRPTPIYVGGKTQDVSQKIALDLPPEKAVTDYFKTKYEERLLVK